MNSERFIHLLSLLLALIFAVLLTRCSKEEVQPQGQINRFYFKDSLVYVEVRTEYDNSKIAVAFINLTNQSYYIVNGDMVHHQNYELKPYVGSVMHLVRTNPDE